MASKGATPFERKLLAKIQGLTGDAPIRFVFGDSDGVLPFQKEPVDTVFIGDRKTLVAMALNPEVGFGDGYAAGTIRIGGDLIRLLENLFYSGAGTGPAGLYRRTWERWQDWRQANTREGSARNIHHHYDLTNEFYKLWLDPRLIYTCAYFPSPDASLEEAQQAKLDYVCRKVQLRPGERVIEAGCGWGALAIHMAKNYGVNVRAFNISREQIQFARERAKTEGLTHLVEFIEDDYRNISGTCDAFVSVGMLEHVGAENYEELGAIIHRSIGNSGRGFLHFIGRNQPRAFSRWIRKRIFPGAYAPTLGEALGMLQPWNFSVQDVENLRFHYAKTLEHWLNRFENSLDQVSKMFDAEFVRAWRLYLAGSLVAFRVGSLQLFQVVFAGSECKQIPWTRQYLYREDAQTKEESRWIHAMS
ncbi:MAG: cyclopropane-fatty-acyl-phospholipid synthase family protein [Candidatus Acidiferrales bacterium]|jgi:cyclopropane-fatty-acyl-phospholipid synthase